MTQPRTHLRICGSADPVVYRQYKQFGYHRVSSRLRGEDWKLTWEQWRDIWGDRWPDRGREKDALCMARIDMDGEWSENNVELITRSEHGRRIRAHHQ